MARKVVLKIVATDADGHITRPTPGEQLAAITRAAFESFGKLPEIEQAKTLGVLAEWLSGNPKLSAALGLAVSQRAARAPAAPAPWAPVELRRATFAEDGTPNGAIIFRGTTLEDIGNLGVKSEISEDGESISFKMRWTS